MPHTEQERDRVAQEFSQRVADGVMAVISARGVSVREVAAASGINRTTLQDRVNNVRPFNTDELAAVAQALGVEPANFMR